MDSRKFKMIYGDAMKNISSLQDLQKLQEEQRIADESAKAAIVAADEKKKKDEEAKKGLLQKAGEKAVEIGKGIAGTAERVAGTAAQGAVSLAAAGEVGYRLATGDKAGAQKRGADYSKTLTDIGHAKAIDDGSMSFISDKTLEGKNSVAGFGAEFTKAGADTASFIQPELKGVGILKGVASEAGINTATTGIASAADQYAKTGKVDAGQTINDAVAGGVTAGVLRGGRGVLSRLKNGPDATAPTKPGDTTAPTDSLAADEAAAAKVIKDANAHLSDGQFAKISDNELTKQIDQFQNGERTANTQADYARYQQLQDEAKFRATQTEKAAFQNNGLPNDPVEAQKALDNLDAGNLPDTAYQPMKPDIKSVAEIFAHDQLPAPIKSAAQEVMDDQGKVNTMLDGLMNDKKYETSHIEMDHAYNARLREISQYPEPRQIAERQKLDTQYKDDLAELEMHRTKDLPEVEQWNSIKDKLDAREQQVVADTNLMIENNPDAFRIPNEKEVAAQRQILSDNLDQAKRFHEPDKIVNEVAQSNDPQATFDRTPDAQPAYQKSVDDSIAKMDNTEAVKANYKSLTSTQLAAARITSPSQWLQHMGLRNEAVDLHTNLLRGKELENSANEANSKVLKEIADNLPNDKNAVGQIWDYLEGKRQTIDVGNEKVAADIRALLDSKRAELKTLGFDTLDNYMPHVFDKKDPMVQSLFKGKVTGEITAANLKHRVMNSDEYSRDTIDVLATYLTSINRKVYLEPSLKALDDVKVQVELADGEAKLIDDYITQLKGFNTSAVGSAYNTMMDGVFKKVGMTNLVGQNHYSTGLSTQRMISAVATMGLNPGTAIRNLTQGVNTVAEIGPRYSTIGAVDGLRMLGTEAGRAELKRVGIFDGGVSRNFYDSLTKTGVQGRISKGVEASTKALMSLIHVTDISLRTQAYAGAKALAASKGLTGKAAEDFAIRKVVDTQFVTSVVDTPLAFNGQGMKSLTQLASFSGKQAGFLKRTGMNVIKDGQTGRYRLDPKAAGSLMSAAVLAAVTTEMLKPVIGMRETEWIPFYDQAAPIFGGLTGNPVQGGDSLYRSPLVRLMFGDGKSKTGLLQAIQQGGDMNKFWEDNWSQIVPVGTQIKKSTEGYQTTTTGESRNSSGNIRYLQNMDPNSTLNATLFGQYATENGSNWIDQGFPTLSDSQTKSVDAQATRSAKEQYADFYTAIKQNAGGRQDAYDEVKAAALTGNQTRAAAAAKTYNDKLVEAEAEYRSKHQDLPQKLQDELDSMRLNVSKITDNARN